MKFKDLFNEDWSVNWDKILTLSHFSKLLTTPQSSTWHREGNVYTHLQLVTQAMEKLLNRNLIEKGSENWVMSMSAAICHDLGKGETTKWSEEKNDWTTKNHGVVGERITRHLFYDENIVLREKVCYMVRHHMTLHHIYDKPEETDKRLIKLSYGIVPLSYMILLNIADSRGSINDIETEDSIYDKELKLTNDVSILRCYQKPYSFIDKSQLIRNFIDYTGGVINDRNDFCVYILCGFPGCGKSTYYKEFLADKPIISRDIIRGELGIDGATTTNDKKVVGTREEEDKVSEIFNKKMIECCENKESFVLDNTNLKYQYRKDYLLKIMKYNPKVKIIYIEAPNYIKDCIDRRKDEIPKKVYDRMENNFDFPQLFECNELIIVKQHSDGTDETHTFNGDLAPDLADDIRFVGGKEYISKSKILNDLKITRGAMILDGYDCYDSCVKFMDELIRAYENVFDHTELFGEIP
jgi:predicted kinase